VVGAIGAILEKDWQDYGKFTNDRGAARLHGTKEKPLPDPERGIAACRRDFGEMALTWRALAARSAPRARIDAEAQVFNQMVVALQARFGEGPRGRVALEVRLLAQGVRAGGWFPEAGPGWRAAQSVTGYRPGDRIALSEAVFARLSEAFLDQVAGMGEV
jgi:hypothetical protein